MFCKVYRCKINDSVCLCLCLSLSLFLYLTFLFLRIFCVWMFCRLNEVIDKIVSVESEYEMREMKMCLYRCLLWKTYQILFDDKVEKL